MKRRTRNRHCIVRNRGALILTFLTLVSVAAAAGAWASGNFGIGIGIFDDDEADGRGFGSLREAGPDVLRADPGRVATQPSQPSFTDSSTNACDLTHLCDLVIADPGGLAGHGFTIKTSFNPREVKFRPNLPFILNETIHYPEATNGVGGECFPSGGTISISVNSSTTLVLDFQGQACQLGSRNYLVFDGFYVADSASTGMAGQTLDAIGSMQMETPSGLSGGETGLKLSLRGQLLFTKPPK